MYRKDSKWHHLAVTWSFTNGKTELFFDGVPRTATWKSAGEHWHYKPVNQGGVDPYMAASTLRFPQGCCNLAATHDWTVVQSIHQMNACHPETQNWSPSPYEYGQLCLANCQNHILNMILTFV